MHGIGNDFVILDAEENDLGQYDLAELSRQLCDRHHGIGADGLLTVERGTQADWLMRVINSDGSTSEMCGNGLRCHARYLMTRKRVSNESFDIETGAGVLQVQAVGDLIRINMGAATSDLTAIMLPHDLTGYDVSMGNPHTVIPVLGLESVPLHQWGPEIESLPRYPHRTNVHFIEVTAKDRIRQLTWERGAGATLACGTGACASAYVAHHVQGLLASVVVELPGGPLQIEVGESEMWMTGPAEFVFEGTWG
jgi:diaminopimelate epimerase